MSRTPHDSGLQLLPAWSPTQPPSGTGGEMLQLDLASGGPLPLELPPPSPAAAAALSPAGATATASQRPGAQGGAAGSGTVWLRGGSLMCACPDCRAPMTIRVWLMIADCWRCGTSIELSEEQEREVRRLLEQTAPSSAVARTTTPRSAPAPRPATGPQDPAAQPRTPAQGPRREPAAPSATPSRTPAPAAPPATPPTPSPATREAPPRRVAAATRPIGVRAKIGTLSTQGSAYVILQDLFKDMPAWLISMVFHLALLTLLGIFTLEDENREPQITLTVDVSRHVREGGDTTILEEADEVKFDLPVPPQHQPKNEQQRRALVLADQEARLLRLDPNTPDPQLPELSQVKQILSSGNTERAALAVRDPRLRVEVIQREGGTTLTEAAVARGLHWMAEHQNPDGSWSLHAFDQAPQCRQRCRGHGRLASDSAATSLCLLPFLGAGQTHLTGRYQDTVAHALRWLIEHQRPDGDLRHDSRENSGMYAHGQGAIVLCEAFGLTNDESLREPAQRAINFIVAAQHSGGGWRYQPREPGDTSVLGWQLMALHSARNVALEVPAASLENAAHYLDRVQSDEGAQYAYMPDRPPTHVMTAEALLCRMFLGWKLEDPGLHRGIALLSSQHLPHQDDFNIYYWYYGTQVMHHAGGPPWEQWNQKMRDILVQSQVTSGHEAGSWPPHGPHADAGGRLYVTALAVCTLEVYYRHAPIFRQLKLD